MGCAKCVPSSAWRWIASTIFGWAWPDDHRAVARGGSRCTRSVDVPEAVPLAAVDEDRVRRRVLPARGDAAGHVSIGGRAVLDRRAVRRLERRLLALDQTVDQVEIELDLCRHGAISSFEEPPQPSARTAIERRFKLGRDDTPGPFLWVGRPLVSCELQRGGCSSARLERLVVVQEAAGSNPVTHPRGPLVDFGGPLAQSGRATDS